MTEVSGVANGNKSEDNPTGQNINVTFKPTAVGGDALGGGGLVAHEGSHVADGSDWVKSGFSSNMNPSNLTSEMNAYHVQFNIMNSVAASRGWTKFNMKLSNGATWDEKATFKGITPDLQQRVIREIQNEGRNPSQPVSTKGWRLEP